jgi:hypothetical protein
MNIRHIISAGIVFAGLMMNGPEQATASAGLGVEAVASAHSYVALTQFRPYKYGRYVVPYDYRRPFIYTYPPPSYRPYRYYRYPRFYYYPPLYYFRN